MTGGSSKPINTVHPATDIDRTAVVRIVRLDVIKVTSDLNDQRANSIITVSFRCTHLLLNIPISI